MTTRTKNSLWLFDNGKYTGLLSQEILRSGAIKSFDILCYQIMPDHLHMLAYQYSQRTLEKVRCGWESGYVFLPTERTLSSVRSDKVKQYNISDLMQSIKGNFSRKIHKGNIWQKRFYFRIINNEFYLDNAIEYIKQNPIKERLPSKYHKFPYQYFDENKICKLF